MDKPNTEPSAQDRMGAAILYQRYVALCNAGFTEQQALIIIGQMLSATIIKGDG